MSNQHETITFLVNELDDGFTDALTGLVERPQPARAGRPRLAERIKNGCPELLMGREPAGSVRLPQAGPLANGTSISRRAVATAFGSSELYQAAVGARSSRTLRS